MVGDGEPLFVDLTLEDDELLHCTHPKGISIEKNANVSCTLPNASPSIACESQSFFDVGIEDSFFPNIHDLFALYNDLYFFGSLGCVLVEWSSRMTQCAGLCVYKGPSHITIRLSAKLLQLRPVSDLVNTLLHEMIHAFLFVTQGPRRHDRDGHGEDFCAHMNRINSMASAQITVYHTFHDEVDHFRTHVWRCDGECRSRPPFFGLVKRASNRAPSPADFWWSRHAASCAGSFQKIASPPPAPKRKAQSASKIQPKSTNQRKVSEFFIGD